MSLPSPRQLYGLAALFSVFLMGFALYLSNILKLEPCPLCMSQRAVVILTGFFCFLAFCQNPRSLGQRIYGCLIMLSSGIGAGLAARQLWLQNLPADQVPACGPGLEYMLDVFPLSEVILMTLKGTGDCAEVQWVFLGLSIPGWTLLCFLGYFCFGLLQLFWPRTRLQ